MTIGLSKSTYHYRGTPRPRVEDPVPHSERPHPAKLTKVEDDAIVTTLRASTVSVTETYYRHLDSGDYVASLSTFHRIARREAIPMARTGSRRRKPRQTGGRKTPTLCATAPGEIACWDITFLPGKYRGHNYALYVIIDLFSRMILGWTIQDREDAVAATDLIKLVAESLDGRLKTVHSDNGAAMTSDQMTNYLRDADITQSFIRPGVSNDNAQIESFFRTIKYGPTWPDMFSDVSEANGWFDEFVEIYNQEHRHTSLAGFTPSQVFRGTWIRAAKDRQDTLDNAYRANPHRYRKPPIVELPAHRVTLNLANKSHQTHTPPTLLELLAA